jgi:hypothetical protein
LYHIFQTQNTSAYLFPLRISIYYYAKTLRYYSTGASDFGACVINRRGKDLFIQNTAS